MSLKRESRYYKYLLCLVLLVQGCAFNFDLTSQRTALENQVMGAYKELDDELVLSAAARSAGTASAPTKPAVIAGHNQMYNIDEIKELKDAGLLGEGQDGYIKKINRKDPGTNVPKVLLDNLDALFQAENSDREVIWRYIIEENKNLSSSDLPNIRRTYAKVMQEKSFQGHWYQDESGAWVQKN
jgi:hypothetical protein